MYRILIIGDISSEIEENIDQKKHIVELIEKENVEDKLKIKDEYDFIYVQKNLVTKEDEQIILTKFEQLPRILYKFDLSNGYVGFVNMQIVNKLIIENLKIIEFEDYFEEMVIANIIKQMIIKEIKLKQVYDSMCKNKLDNEQARKAAKKVIIRNYAINNIIRKCQYILKQRTIQRTFFDKIIQNIKNDIENMENLKLDEDKYRKIKVIIADDDYGNCDLLNKNLKKCENIEVLGIANNDEDEIKLIENLKPDIVITDLLRNHKYTGLEIIKQYSAKDVKPQFLVISAGRKEDFFRDGLEVGGYIKKPFNDYSIVVNELERIKKEMIAKQKQFIIEKNTVRNKLANILKANAKNKK